LLHDRRAEKIAAIAAWPPTAPIRVNPEVSSAKAVVASGVAFAHAGELFAELGISDRVALYQVIQPFPLHSAFIDHLLETYAEILVLEESAPVIEMQVADRRRVRGRMSGAVPGPGELLPEIIACSPGSPGFRSRTVRFPRRGADDGRRCARAARTGRASTPSGRRPPPASTRAISAATRWGST
jgi:TPP-dependent indolepyruvate ferredoxin oxidoreductase alpha subunit